MQPCSTTIYGVCSVKRRSRAKSWESFQTPLQLGQTILLLTTKLFHIVLGIWYMNMSWGIIGGTLTPTLKPFMMHLV